MQLLDRIRPLLFATRPGTPSAYLSAVAMVALATLVRIAIDPWIVGVQFIFYFPVVMLTTLIFGVGAGSFAVLLSAIAAEYFFFVPKYSFQLFDLPEVVTLVLFGLVGFASVAIAGGLRTVLGRLSRLQQLDAAIFEANPDAIVMVDQNGRILRINERVKAMFGYSEGALLNQSVDLLVPPALRARHAELRAGFIAAPQAREMGAGANLSAQRASGEIFPVGVRLGPVGVDGEIRVIANIRDLTDQKAVQAESERHKAMLEQHQQIANQLSRANDKLSKLIESAPVAIWAIDADGRVTMWNPAAEKIMGVPVTDAIGHSWRTVVREPLTPDGHGTEELLHLAERQGGFHDINVQRIAKDGATLELSISAALLYDNAQNVTDFLFIAHDFTRTKELERRLQNSQKMEAIGQLTGGVAHDFNNLLAVIYGNLEALKDEGPPDPMAAHLIDGALLAAERGASLTRRLLAFSRRQMLMPTDVDVGSLVAGTIDMLRRIVEESVKIVMTIPEGLWKSHVDAEQLASALVNLVVNARDAMPNGGTLTIAAENTNLKRGRERDVNHLAPGPYVKLSITDTGEGMTKDTLDRALEPFFTTKPYGQGTGLGLSMVYGFVTQSGGHLALASTPGQGTTVTLYLPKAQSEIPTAEAGSAKPEPATAEGEVILLVEDDDLVRNLQVQTLHKLGYRTLEAADGPSCIEIIKSPAHVDLLLTDIVMPGGMNGPALAKAARTIRPDLKVVFMSGYAPEDVRQEYDLSGARSLSKPFTRSELAEAIHETLEGR